MCWQPHQAYSVTHERKQAPLPVSSPESCHVSVAALSVAAVEQHLLQCGCQRERFLAGGCLHIRIYALLGGIVLADAMDTHSLQSLFQDEQCVCSEEHCAIEKHERARHG